MCEGCVARSKRCTEQRPELLQQAALDTRETLRERIARLEAIIEASGLDADGAAQEPKSHHSELEFRDAPQGVNQMESSGSLNLETLTPSSIPSTSVQLTKDTPQNIDPIVTLFDNAIVSYEVC